jgi:hypothetical protein
MYFFRLRVRPNGDSSELVLDRLMADYHASMHPDFSLAESLVLADGVSGIRIRYYGTAGDAIGADATWHEAWHDAQRLPDLTRIEVDTANGPEWPPIVVETALGNRDECGEYERVHNICERI